MLEPNQTLSPEDAAALTWFAGDVSALDLYKRLSYIAHAWDDLIDQDKPVEVNSLMCELLLHLPGNDFYRRYEIELRTLFLAGISGYMASNIMAKSGNLHKLEIAHYLRYSVMSAIQFMVVVLNGMEKGAQILADAAPFLMNERIDDYLREQTAKIDPRRTVTVVRR